MTKQETLTKLERLLVLDAALCVAEDAIDDRALNIAVEMAQISMERVLRELEEKGEVPADFGSFLDLQKSAVEKLSRCPHFLI